MYLEHNLLIQEHKFYCEFQTGKVNLGEVIGNKMAYQQMEIIGEESSTQLIEEHCIQTLQFDEDCISSTFIVFYSFFHCHNYVITGLT